MGERLLMTGLSKMGDLFPSDDELPSLKEEATNLQLHVEMCELRARRVNKKLRRVELTTYLILGFLLFGGAISVDKLQAILSTLKELNVESSHQPQGPRT